jgi:hypothetical protein
MIARASRLRPILALVGVSLLLGLTGCSGGRTEGSRGPTTVPLVTTAASPAVTDPGPLNGQITDAQSRFGADTSDYGWRSFGPVSDTGLFVTGPVGAADRELGRLAVVARTGRITTLTCARALWCSKDDWLSHPATLGPGADEVTVRTGDRTARVIGYDGTAQRSLDLGATTARGGKVIGLRWSADGSRLAVLTAENHDGQALLLEVRTRNTLHGADVVVLHLQPEGATDPVTAQTLYHSNRHFDSAGNLAWSPDGTRIAVRTRTGVTEISAADGSVIAHHPHIDGWVIWPRRHPRKERP